MKISSPCTHYPPARDHNEHSREKTHDYFPQPAIIARSKRILPPFLFHYIWMGGHNFEYALRRNVEDLSGGGAAPAYSENMSDLSPETTLFNEKLSMPVALGPVGLCGMYARQRSSGCKAADAHGIPFTLSTVSVAN